MNHQLPFRLGEQTIENVVIGDNSSAYIGSFSSYNVQEQRNAQQALSFPEMYDRQHQIQAESPDTCSWILEDPVFVLWQESSQGLLWIKGKPGAGKSTIMSYIWRILARSRKSQSSVTACFFCHGRGRELLQRSPKGVYRALLHQIVQQVQQLNAEFAEDFEARCKARGPHGSAWDWEDVELRTFLSNYLNRASRDIEVLILVDALDECGENAAKELLRWFLQQSDKIASETGHQSYLKVCVSSRHYPLVATGVPYMISVDDNNSADIHEFVEHELGQVICQGAEYDQLLSAIVSGAENIFQWAVVVVARVIRSIEDDKSIEMVLEDIIETPQELFPLYQQILRTRLDTTNITSKDRRRFSDLFQWVALAKRPLSLEELDFALSAQSSDSEPRRKGNTSKRYVERLSCGLISLATDHDGQSIVQFIHHSVQEYFLSGQGIRDLGHPGSSMNTRAMHLDIVKTCYQSILPSRALDPRTRTPLHRYASHYMFAHARSAEEEQAVQHDLARILKWPQEDFVKTLAAFSPNDHVIFGGLEYLASKGLCLLHFAAAFDIPNLVSSVLMLAPDMDINTCDSNGRTALHHAAEESSHGALDRLLDIGRRSGTISVNRALNLNARTFNGDTPLMTAAARYGSDTVLERLAQTPGVDLNAVNNVTHSTALHSAIKDWRVAAARILIHHGADIRLKDNGLRTPLSITVEHATYDARFDTFYTTDDDRKEAFALLRSLLAEAKEDLYLRDDQGNTPLQIGLSSAQSRIFAKALLGEGLDPNTPDQYGCTWLSYLGDHTTSGTVRLLLAQSGVDVNIRDGDGRTILARWVNRDHVNKSAVKRLLKDPRVDASSRDHRGRTPLMIAAAKSCFSGVSVLLKNARSDAQALDDDNHSAMYHAVARKSEIEAQQSVLYHLKSESLTLSRKTIEEEVRREREEYMAGIHMRAAEQTIKLLERHAKHHSVHTIDRISLETNDDNVPAVTKST